MDKHKRTIPANAQDDTPAKRHKEQAEPETIRPSYFAYLLCNPPTMPALNVRTERAMEKYRISVRDYEHAKSIEATLSCWSCERPFTDNPIEVCNECEVGHCSACLFRCTDCNELSCDTCSSHECELCSRQLCAQCTQENNNSNYITMRNERLGKAEVIACSECYILQRKTNQTRLSTYFALALRCPLPVINAVCFAQKSILDEYND